jgi:hypothetical protein
MLSLGAGTRRVYLAVGATDLLKGFDGLYGLVRTQGSIGVAERMGFKGTTGNCCPGLRV